MSVEGVVLVSVVVLGFSVALVFIARAFGKNAETMREVIVELCQKVKDSNTNFSRLTFDASEKAHALSDEYREMYIAKVEAFKNDDGNLVKLNDDEKQWLAVYRQNRQMDRDIANPPPDPAAELLNAQ